MRVYGCKNMTKNLTNVTSHNDKVLLLTFVKNSTSISLFSDNIEICTYFFKYNDTKCNEIWHKATDRMVFKHIIGDVKVREFPGCNELGKSCITTSPPLPASMGETVSIICPSGTFHRGNRTVRCGYDGSFVGNWKDFCQTPVTCNRLVPDIETKHWQFNEITSYDNKLKGFPQDATANVTCEPNFNFENLDGTTTKIRQLTCGDDGFWKDGDVNWENENEKCKNSIRCEIPPNIVPQDQLYYSERAELKCTDLDMYSNQSGFASLMGNASHSEEVECGKSGKIIPELYCGTHMSILVNLTSDMLDYAPSKTVGSDDKFILATKPTRIITSIELQQEVVTTLVKSLQNKKYSYVFVKTDMYRYTNPATLVAVSVVVIPPRGETTKATIVSGAAAELRSVLRQTLWNGAVTVEEVIKMTQGTCVSMYDNTSKGKYQWDAGNALASQSKDCTADPRLSISATCTCNEQGICMWKPDYSACPFESEVTNKIVKINTSRKTAKVKAQELATVTKDITHDAKQNDFQDEVYDIAAQTIESIIEGLDNNSLPEEDMQEINTNIISIIDKFASAGQTVAYKQPIATEQYLKSLDKVLGTISLDVGRNKKNIERDNVKIAMIELPRDKVGTLTLRQTAGGVTISNSLDGKKDDSDKDQENSIVMRIPPQIVERLPETNRFYFVVFEHATFFTTEELYTGHKTLQSKIFSAGVTGQENIVNINPPIEFDFKKEECTGPACNSSVCVYWKESGENYMERIIAEVQTVSITKDKVMCETDHLTSFAILMSSKPMPKIHKNILEAITYIGCSLSIIGLIMSLVGLSVFRSIRQGVATKIHINMNCALLCGLLVFTIGVEQYNVPLLCYTTAFLIHYFILSAIFWMGIEGFHLYVLVVRVFGTVSNKFLLKCAAFAWGLPAVIVAATAGWDLDNYNTADLEFCWMHRLPMIVMFMAPTMLVILVNTYMFVRIVSEITKSQNRMKNDNMPSTCCRSLDLRAKLMKVRAAISIMVLMGLTWALGPIMLLDMVPGLEVAIMYMFTVCNSLQGFLFFFFHCAIKTDVKDRWKTYLGIESGHTKLSDHISYDNGTKNNPNLNTQRTTEFSKLGDSASSLNKLVPSFKPKFNKVRPNSADDDTDLAVVEF